MVTGMEVVWFVGSGEEQVKAYKSAGARTVVEGGGLCKSRNAALEYALEQLVQRRPDDPIGFVANKLLEADIQARAAPLGLGKAVRASQRAAAKRS